MTQEEQARMQALEEKLACLESIIEHVSEGVILTDQDCRIVEFNPAKERMEHMRASDVLGMVSWEAYTVRYPSTNRFPIPANQFSTHTGRMPTLEIFLSIFTTAPTL